MDEDLKTLMQLAQLQHTISAPQQEQQQIDQADQHQKMQSALQLMQLMQAKQHSQQSTQDDLIHTLAQRTDMTSATLGEIAAALGRPEIAQGIKAAHGVNVASEVAQKKLLLQHAQSDKAKNEIISTIKDPEVMAGISAFLPPPVNHTAANMSDAGRTYLENTVPGLVNPAFALAGPAYSIYRHLTNQ